MRLRTLASTAIALILSGPALAGPAPRFNLKKLDGTTFNSQDVVGKQVVLVDFWATWCGPCTQMLKKLQALKDRYPDVLVLAVSIDDANSMAKVSQYVQGRGFNFTVLLDPESRLNRQVNPAGGVPFTLLIDRKGEVVYSHAGYVPGDEQTLIAKIEALRK